MSINPFSLSARRRSFAVAFTGLFRFFREEPHAWLHLAGTVTVIIFAGLLGVSVSEAGWLVLSVGLVWLTELFNTSLEKLTDFVSLERQPQLKYIKDLAAAAVLVASITASILGGIVFIPKLF